MIGSNYIISFPSSLRVLRDKAGYNQFTKPPDQIPQGKPLPEFIAFATWLVYGLLNAYLFPITTKKIIVSNENELSFFVKKSTVRNYPSTILLRCKSV